MGTFYTFLCDNHALSAVEDAMRKRSMTLNLSSYELKALPLPVTKLHDLMKLYLHKNYLENLPNEITLLTNLKLLTADYNNLVKLPSPLKSFQFLKSLNLSHNPLKSLPSEIGDLTKLEVLWLNHTQLESFPPEIGKLNHLDTLGARNNLLTNLPSEICKLKRLRWLTLEGNLIEHLPTNFERLKMLVHLNLNKNKIIDVPLVITAMKNLRFCFLADNIVKNINESMLEQIEHVRKLDLKGNPLGTNNTEYKNIPNIVLDYECDTSEAPDDGDTWDSDSEFDLEDWEFSIASSEIDAGNTSGDEREENEFVPGMLPDADISRFAITG